MSEIVMLCIDCEYINEPDCEVCHNCGSQCLVPVSEDEDE